MTNEKPNLAKELVLLLVLSTLWGASYTFIKVGVQTIPPVTLIAARTFIAGMILIAIIQWRGLTLPQGCDHLAAVSLSGVPQQRSALHADRMGTANHGRGARDDPKFHFADLRLPAHRARHAP